MARKFVVTHIDEHGGETILAVDADADAVIDVVVDDLMASDVLGEHDEQTRADACRMLAATNGLMGPNPREIATVRGRTYRVEVLPDDPVALDEFYNARLTSPKLLKLRCRLPGKLRYEIWPNEPQHRGRPHCKVSRVEKSASFSIPDGERIVGDISPDEREASDTIRRHGDELLALWHRMRPDDQKL